MEAKRLLLVEDESPFKRSLETFFKRGGYTFDSCSTSREALIQAGLCRYDVVIVDYRLSDGDGLGLIRSLRALCPDLTTIMISAYDYQVLTHERPENYVDCYLRKPFDPVDLETAVRSACSRPDGCRAETQARGLVLRQ